jgi:transposase InsO family protein
LTSKTQIQSQTIELLTYIETHVGRPVSKLLLDQGSNFTSNEVVDYFRQRGIDWSFSPVDTPQSNGKSERLHYTLMDDVRCMLAQRNLPHKLWPYAMDYACYTRNLCPIKNKSQVPDHTWTNIRPSVGHLREFGTRCFPRIPGKDQNAS